MSERRPATRREPIEVVVDDGRVFIARPLPWTQVNDLGSEIVRQNQDATNEFIRLWITDAGLPQLEMQFAQKITDWQAVLRLAYPDVAEDMWTQPRILDTSECVELGLAALDVNSLEKLRPLVDPNLPTPMLNGGLNSTAEGIGTKTTSTQDSGSPDSPEREPLTSPEASSL